MASPTGAASLRSASTARTTAAAFVLLLASVALARATPLPAVVSVVAWPALAAAFLLDAALYNDAGVATGDVGFWALFVAWCYVEAVAGVALGRTVLAWASRR